MNINIDAIQAVARIDDILIQMKKNLSDVRFTDLSKGCIYNFGQARQKDESRHVYKTPWQGDSRINMQNHQGKAKAGQVKQVMAEVHGNPAFQAAESGVSLTRIAGAKLSR